MPIFLDTSGKSTLGIGICGRCSRKMSLTELRSDGNIPGLMVCDADWDTLDPWRLAARGPDQIALRFARPDTPLTPGTPYVPPTS